MELSARFALETEETRQVSELREKFIILLARFPLPRVDNFSRFLRRLSFGYTNAIKILGGSFLVIEKRPRGFEPTLITWRDRIVRGRRKKKKRRRGNSGLLYVHLHFETFIATSGNFSQTFLIYPIRFNRLPTVHLSPSRGRFLIAKPRNREQFYEREFP